MSRLEKATHILLLAVCGVSLTVLVKREFLPARSMVARSRVGQKLSLPGGAARSFPATVVIVLSSNCQYCRASLPFYRRVLEWRLQRAAAVRVIAVSPDAPEVVREFLDAGGVKVDEVLQATLRTLGAPGTPTIYVVDAHGLIRSEFFGQLSDEREKALLAKLGG